MKLIIAYKLIKAIAGGSLVVWITLWQQGATDVVERFATDLSHTHAIWSRAGEWLQANISPSTERTVAMLLLLDATTTGLEGVLLLSGRAWAEWVVVFSVGLFVPLELVSLDHKPSALKLVVLSINVAMVVYLVMRRRAASSLKS